LENKTIYDTFTKITKENYNLKIELDILVIHNGYRCTTSCNKSMIFKPSVSIYIKQKYIEKTSIKIIEKYINDNLLFIENIRFNNYMKMIIYADKESFSLKFLKNS
jgi:hypothetical protein